MTKRVGHNLGIRAIAIVSAAALGGAPLAMGACSFDAVGEGAPAISDDAFAGDANVDTGHRTDTGAHDAGGDSADANDASDANDAASTDAATPDASSPDASTPDASTDASTPDGGHDSAVPDAGAHDAGLG